MDPSVTSAAVTALRRPAPSPRGDVFADAATAAAWLPPAHGAANAVTVALAARLTADGLPRSAADPTPSLAATAAFASLAAVTVARDPSTLLAPVGDERLADVCERLARFFTACSGRLAWPVATLGGTARARVAYYVSTRALPADPEVVTPEGVAAVVTALRACAVVASVIEAAGPGWEAASAVDLEAAAELHVATALEVLCGPAGPAAAVVGEDRVDVPSAGWAHLTGVELARPTATGVLEALRCPAGLASTAVVGPSALPEPDAVHLHEAHLAALGLAGTSTATRLDRAVPIVCAATGGFPAVVDRHGTRPLLEGPDPLVVAAVLATDA